MTTPACRSPQKQFRAGEPYGQTSAGDSYPSHSAAPRNVASAGLSRGSLIPGGAPSNPVSAQYQPPIASQAPPPQYTVSDLPDVPPLTQAGRQPLPSRQVRPGNHGQALNPPAQGMPPRPEPTRQDGANQQPNQAQQGAPEVLGTPPGTRIAAGETLLLREVVASVATSYPLLESLWLQRTVADGKQTATLGEFDLGLKAETIAAPEGFYETYRSKLGISQPLFGGGELFGGYKIGDGNFQPWFGERETDEGGELSAGFHLPFLKDRQIDKRRAALFKAQIGRQAVEPLIQGQLLEFTRFATMAYWDWVAAGQSLEAQRELLRNAQARVEQINTKVEAGDIPKISRINNQQLIASREAKLIESDRKLQKAAIKLSLFIRDSEGRPIVPTNSQLPLKFPRASLAGIDQLEGDIARALEASPLLQELSLAAEQAEVELRNSQNLLLPKFDARLRASQDVGRASSSKQDKSEFEVEAGLFGEVPFQRRLGRGKVTAAQGKIAQINAKQRFVANKITAAVQDAYSALQAASEQIKRAETNLRLARETLRLGRVSFDAGDADVVTLNIYEKAVTDAQLLLISAQANFFQALANYRAALAAPTDVDH